MRPYSTLLSLFIAAASVANATVFDDAVDTLVANNLSLKADRQKGLAEIENILSENQLSGPEAEFSRVWGSNAEIGNKWALSVSQGFDWPGIYRARRLAANQAKSAMQMLQESSLLDARLEARRLLIDAVHLHQLLEMQDTLAFHIDKMLELYRIGAENGTETRLDYNKTVLERISVHRELHSLQSQWAELIAQIKVFNGGNDPETIISAIGTTYPPIPSHLEAPSLETLKERDPAYAAALARREQQLTMTKVNKLSRLPGFSVGYVHETELGGNFDGFSIGISLPSWGKNHAATSTIFEAESSMLDAEIQITEKSATLQADAARLRALRKVIDEYEPVVNDQSNFTLLRKAFDAGQISYLTYIEECNYFLAARRDYADTLHEFHTLLTSITRYD